MNWFKHDTGASNDAKVKRLILQHGAEGYAIYFHCLELIAGDLKETNITFELEHDAVDSFEAYWRPRLSMAGELLRDRQHYGKNIRRDAV